MGETRYKSVNIIIFLMWYYCGDALGQETYFNYLVLTHSNEIRSHQQRALIIKSSISPFKELRKRQNCQNKTTVTRVSITKEKKQIDEIMQMGVNGFKAGAPEFCQPASIYQLLANKKRPIQSVRGIQWRASLN